MKTTEIMIGDWFFYGNLTFCVAEIIKNEVVSEMKKDIKTGMPYDIKTRVENLTPMPLTPKFIKSLGFDLLRNGANAYSFHHQAYDVWATGFKDTKEWLICIGPVGSTKERFVHVSRIKYIHELQHALKLCKTEKEIVL